ncbi:MAG: SpoIIE family protein phosphatase [Kiritimatiellales bacterium]|nr:SpoIIE family protein phosphatase [Kiritimatiellales bacterium]
MSEQFKDTGFLLQNLMDNISDNIYFKDRQSRFIMVNKSFLNWHHLGAATDALGKTDFDLFSDVHARQAYEDEQRIIKTGEPLLGIEEKETWQDGRVTWVSTTKMPLKSDAGEIIGTFGVSRDITKHKEAELRAARYAEEIRRIKEEMEEDVRMAGELQKTFFPSSYPLFPENAELGESIIKFHHHYHAGGMVGGDFCSVHRLSDHEAGIFLCDVMGHGVRAALGTALIRAVVEEISPLEKDPGQYLARMNELLLPILRQEDVFLYATACYLIVDVATGRVRFANAGHPMPMHFDSADNDVHWLLDDHSLRGPALAIDENAEYRTIEKMIRPGDAVVMYTDGIYEVAGAEKEEFGENRLIEAARKHVELPLLYLFPALINEACLFAEEGAFDDDVCLVGFRLKELLK